MRRLLSYALTARQWPHHRAFEAATRRPREAQAAVLRALLRDNGDTLFGREHGFGDLTPAEYARRVPVRDYEALRPYVTRALAGEPDVLTAETPFTFASTSGTTGEPKLVPVTPSSARAMAALMRLWTFHALRDHPRDARRSRAHARRRRRGGTHAGRRTLRRDDRPHLPAAALARPAPARPALRGRAGPRPRDALLPGAPAGARRTRDPPSPPRTPARCCGWRDAGRAAGATTSCARSTRGRSASRASSRSPTPG